MIAVFAVLFAFEKIALIDSYDIITCCDVETKAGTEAIIDNALKTGATHVFWRNQSGSMPRYPSKEEACRTMGFPLDKRRLGWEAAQGWARLDRGTDIDNLIAYAFSNLKEKGIGTGIHFTFEENHCASFTVGPWNMEHPEFWTRTKGGAPFHGRCSLAYDEVYEHKMRLVDELLAMKPGSICLDLYRSGDWSLAWEYTPKFLSEYRAVYGETPPDDSTDERWVCLFSKYTERYLRGISERCRKSGVRFMVELAGLSPWGRPDRYHWQRYAVDWRGLAADGVFDALVVAGVNVDAKDVFGSLKKTYEYVYANRGTAKVYYHCSMYDYAQDIPTYSRMTGLSKGEVARKLLELAEACHGEGVIMEVVDWENYTEEVNREIRAFKR